MSATLFGRVTERSQLNEMLVELSAGQGSGAVLILGEAGIGKTRLVDEAAAMGVDLGYRTVRIRSDESDSYAPLSTLVKGLAQGGSDLDASPFLKGREGRGSNDLWVLREIQSMLEKASSATPVLLTVDDIDRADELSRHAVRLLLEMLLSSSVGWVLTARSDAEQRVAELRATVAQCGGRIVTVGPLTDDEALALVEDDLGDAAPEPLASHVRGAGGNPFLIRELVRGFPGSQAGAGPADGPDNAHLPRRAHEALRARVTALPPDARDVLEVAAVVGRAFSVAEVASILRRSPTELLSSVRVLRGSGVVVERNERLMFAHELLRESVLADLPAETVRLLHVAVAEVRLASGHTALDVASHLLAGVGPQDLTMVWALVEASQRLVESTPTQAVTLARRALEITAHDRHEWTRCVAPVIEVLVEAGEVDDALALAARADHACWSPDVEARIRGALSNLLWRRGRTREAMAVVRPALDRPDVSRGSRLHLDLVMARARVLGGTPGEAIAALDSALEDARLTGDQDAVIRALTLQSMAHRFLGHFDKSVDLAAEAVATFDPRTTVRRADPRVWLARSFMATDRLEEADDLGRVLARDAATTSDRHPDLPLLSASTARLLLAQGRLTDAFTEAESGIAAMEAEGGRELAAELFACLALVGWYVEGTTVAASALERAARVADHDRFGMNHLELAALLISTDADPVRVRDLAAPLLSGLAGSAGQLVFDPSHGPSLVRALTEVNLAVEAEPVLDACRALADLNPHIGSWRAAHDHACGLASRDVDLLRAAADSFMSCGRPLASALAMADIAHELHRRKDSGWGPQRDHATTQLRALGASAAATRLERALPSRSATPRRRSRLDRPATGWESLTPAELRVLTVAATGATNKEIAAELWISPYTVDTHMRHILGKMGVRSRVALARLAAERDLRGEQRSDS